MTMTRRLPRAERERLAALLAADQDVADAVFQRSRLAQSAERLKAAYIEQTGAVILLSDLVLDYASRQARWGNKRDPKVAKMYRLLRTDRKNWPLKRLMKEFGYRTTQAVSMALKRHEQWLREQVRRGRGEFSTHYSV